MRVIQPGRLKLDVENTPCACINCGCVFAFRPSEADRIEDSRDGDYFRIACPTCTVLNSVDCRLEGSAVPTSGAGS
jgi:hypothetical protein